MNAILIVEDSKSFGALLQSRLQASFDMPVMWARTHAEATQKIDEADGTFFVAVLDLHLPDAPKGEIVDFVTAQHIPSIILTGKYQSDIRNQLLSQGVLDFFIKDSINVIDLVIDFIKRLQKNKTTQVLVVDDSRSARNILIQTLNRYGFPVLEASDGSQALALIKQHTIRLVITDYEMPEMDGAQLTKKIRAQHSKNDMVVIGLSSKGGQGNHDLAVQFIKAGANDFLSKPFQAEELFWRVTQNLEILESNHTLDTLVKRMSSTLDNALDAIITADREGRIVDFNPSAEQLFGYARGEIIGQNFIDLLIPPALRNRKRIWLKRHAKRRKKAPARQTREELPCLRANGKIIDLELSLTTTFQQDDLYYTAFLHDITDRKQLLKSLKETLAVAESSSQVKSDFMANMSHEIRTPMNAIIGFNELALQTDLPPIIRDYLKKAQSASHALMGIIDDILDFSKIEVGQIILAPEVFNLHDMFDRLANLFTHHTTEKQLELVMFVPHDFDRTLFGDRQRLEQVLIHLIRNAIKFTQTGTIVVRVRVAAQDASQVTTAFSVRDTGVGIDSEHMALLFDPFVQADGSATRQYGGTGLGLTICKNLVALMGGNLKAKSTLGKGSTFSFQLPFECRTPVLKAMPTLPTHLQGMRVLLVEDNAPSKKFISDLLRVFFADIHAVSSGEEALAALHAATMAARHYDVILMDWRLPGMDGIETSAKVVEHVSSVQPPAKIPKIILITSFGKEKIRKQPHTSGIHAFLSKPISRAQMYTSIMNVFGEPMADSDRAAICLTEVAEATGQIGGANILLVEDNMINQEIARALLMGAGLKVSIANNGQEAVEMVRQSSYDAVLMDVQMPEMSGLEATRCIRQDARFTHLPIIAMTSHVMVEEQQACLEAGMNAHLAKPIRPERLYGVLTQWIGPVQSSPATTQEEAPIPIPEIPGIDPQDGLKHVAGNRVIYIRLLVRFRDEYAQIAKKIDKALGKGDLKTAEQLTHPITRVAEQIGANALHQAAKALEHAIKHGKPSEQKPLKRAFNKALTPLLKALEEVEEVERPPAMPPPVENSAIDTEPVKKTARPQTQITALLTELTSLLKENNLETDAIIATLRAPLQSSSAASLLQELEEAIQNYEFDTALHRVEKIVDLLNLPKA